MKDSNYFLIKFSEENFNKYHEFLTKQGKLIYVGTDEFKDHPEIKEIQEKLKILRVEKEELITKLKRDEKSI